MSSYNNLINVGLSSGILIIFFITLAVGYVYIDDTRKSITKMNATVNQILEKQAIRWQTDNIRFNATLIALNAMYQETQSLVRQHEFDREQALAAHQNISNTIANNTANNLNLTKYNRAALTDSNRILRDLAEHFNLTDIEPFDSGRISSSGR